MKLPVNSAVPCVNYSYHSEKQPMSFEVCPNICDRRQKRHFESDKLINETDKEVL